jgi:hypothetical protein
MLIAERLEQLAGRLDLTCRQDKSPDGFDEIYLYSDDTNDPQYRYAFARWWRADGPIVLWVMLNPAKGDTERRPRPTLDRCIARSRSLGGGGLIIANLFAARHNKPGALRTTPDPVGLHNNEVLSAMSALAEHTFVAWGVQGAAARARAAEVIPLLRQPRCLGVTANGQPRHPLYVRKDVTNYELWP